MASKLQVKREPIQFVHQNAIYSETIEKELKYQKCYTEYSINPFTKKHAITGKPYSYFDMEEGEADEKFLEIIRGHSLEPQHKYKYPETEGMEYGWRHKPLVPRKQLQNLKNLIQYPRRNSEITEYMDVALMQNSGKKP